MPSKLTASLSLDLDNKWSYMKTHGDAGWESYPSYLGMVVPRFLDMLAARDLRITVFVVGQDAALKENHAPLKQIVSAGHEIANHSFHHEPWLHLYSREQLDQELGRAEAHIHDATGETTRGFRGPGFSVSRTTLEVLAERGYHYDASTFPTFLGPVARAYYFMTARFDKTERDRRKKLFGNVSDGFRPLRPYRWQLGDRELTELPVTTMPLFKLPFHLSYILYLGQYSREIAITYFRIALMLCRWMKVEPSLLLHPLDFMGGDDDQDLAFFPAMNQSGEEKMRLVDSVLEMYQRHFDVVAMDTHVEQIEARWSTAGQQAPLRSMAETVGEVPA